MIFLAILLGAGYAFAENYNKQESGQNNAAYETEHNFFLIPVKFYQKHISSAIGGRCPMYPSCSHYCVEAVKKHGAVLGWIMTCDRLIRCGRDEVKNSPLVNINGGKFFYDPVKENNFWKD